MGGSGGNSGGTIVTPAPQISSDTNYSGGNTELAQAGIDVNNILSNITLGTDKIKSPKLTISGHEFYLFQVDGKFKLDVKGVNFSVEVDNKKNTLKFMGGYSFIDEKTSTGTGYSEKGEWMKAYNDLKSLRKAIDGKDISGRGTMSGLSSVYKNMKQLNSNLFLNIKGNFAFYGELTFDEGDWKLTEGGGILKASASGSIDPRIGGIFYGTFGLSLDASGTVEITFDGWKKPMSTKVALKLEPAANIGIGAGSKKAKIYIEGGLKGKLPIELAASTDKNKNTNLFEVRLKGYLYVSGKLALLGFENEWPLGGGDDDGVLLYPRNGDITMQSPDDMEEIYSIDKSDLKLLPRNTDNSMELSAMSLSDVFEKNDLYQYSAPKLARLADGRILLLWIDDDAAKADADRTSLYYSIYDPAENVWSSPTQAVTNIGYNDMPQIYVSDDRVHILWTAIDKAYGDTVDIDEMLEDSDLYYTVFDGAGFTEPVLVSDANKKTSEGMYSIYEQDGTVIAAWADNSENNIEFVSGTNTIYKRELKNGAWSDIKTVTSTQKELHNIDIADGRVIYELATGDEGTILYADTNEIGTSENSNTSFGVVDDEVYYLSGTTLNMYDMQTGKTESNEIGEITDITIIDNGNERVALTLLSDGFANELYQNEYKDGKWGAWTQLTEYGKFIRDYSVISNNGSLTAAMNLVEIKDEEKGGYGSADLKVIGDFDYSDIILNDTLYYEGDIVENEDIDIHFDVTNNSRNDIDALNTTITDSLGNVMYNGKINTNIKPGATENLSAPITIPNGFTKRDISVAISSDFDEENLENNSSILTLGYTDIGLDEVRFIQSNNKVKLVGNVRNSGYADAENVMLDIHYSDADGELLKSIEIGTVGILSQNSFEYELPEAYTTVSDGKQAIYVELSTSSDELAIGNNSDRVVFSDLSDLAEISEVSMEYNNDMLVIKTPEAMGMNFVAAYYDENGALLTCRKLELAVGAGTNSIATEGLTTGSNVKFMLWDENMVPLCEPLTWQ